MKCELCKEAEATIHLTQVVDGSVKKVHFCEACAAKSGFDVHGPMSITDILLGLGGSPEQSAPPVKASERSCPRCHMRRVDFKKSGRLGCSDCYATFGDELAPVIRAMHRNDQHRGKVPERERERVRNTMQASELREQLESAIAREDFEEAARLRDALMSLRKAAEQQEPDT